MAKRERGALCESCGLHKASVDATSIFVLRESKKEPPLDPPRPMHLCDSCAYRLKQTDAPPTREWMDPKWYDPEETLT